MSLPLPSAPAHIRSLTVDGDTLCASADKQLERQHDDNGNLRVALIRFFTVANRRYEYEHRVHIYSARLINPVSPRSTARHKSDVLPTRI